MSWYIPLPTHERETQLWIIQFRNKELVMWDAESLGRIEILEACVSVSCYLRTGRKAEMCHYQLKTLNGKYCATVCLDICCWKPHNSFDRLEWQQRKKKTLPFATHRWLLQLPHQITFMWYTYVPILISPLCTVPLMVLNAWWVSSDWGNTFFLMSYFSDPNLRLSETF